MSERRPQLPGQFGLLRCPLHITTLGVCDDSLVCALGHSYPIRDGIARFVPDEGYAESFGFQWERHAITQLDSRNGYVLSRDRFFACTRWPERMEGELVLDAGSGPGRFTEIAAATGATVVALDYSRAIDLNRENHPDLDVTYVQADLMRPPFAPGTFDRVYCMGVLQHTPDPAAAFDAVARLVAPGGHLAVDVYQKTPIALLHWKYVLRPITTRMDSATLYRLCERAVPPMLPLWKTLRRIGGRYASRVLPIASYSQTGIDDELNRSWSILDTFDMYSPKHDHPQTRRTVRRWFRLAGLVDISVEWGPNGVVGRGRRPIAT